MERKQGFLFRAVDIVMELFVMSATLSHAQRMLDDGGAEAEHARMLADVFCKGARRRIKRLFRDLWANQDAAKNAVAADVLAGKLDWLRTGTLDLGWTPDMFRTKALTDVGREVAERAVGRR